MYWSGSRFYRHIGPGLVQRALHNRQPPRPVGYGVYSFGNPRCTGSGSSFGQAPGHQMNPAGSTMRRQLPRARTGSIAPSQHRPRESPQHQTQASETRHQPRGHHPALSITVHSNYPPVCNSSFSDDVLMARPATTRCSSGKSGSNWKSSPAPVVVRKYSTRPRIPTCTQGPDAISRSWCIAPKPSLKMTVSAGSSTFNAAPLHSPSAAAPR